MNITPMLHPRQSIFLQKEEYAQEKEYHEEGISIYITSARYKAEWFWRLFKTTVNESFLNTKVAYNFFASDIFIALKYGLKTIGEWNKILRNNNQTDIDMEYKNEMIGETEDAYFQFELLRKCQKIHKAFRPPTNTEFISGVKIDNREKKPNEIRVLCIDFAFSNSVKGSASNDNTVIECISGTYNNGEIIRNCEYVETLAGGESELTQRRIRELFFDYKADYIIIDLRSGGEIHYVNLTKPYIHPNRDRWDGRGFTVATDKALQFLSDAKISDLQSRTIDANAMPVIIPVQGSLDFNDLMWRSLRSNMVDNKIRLLIDDIEFDAEFAKRKNYNSMTSQEKMLERLPFVQTEFLVREAISLKQELREGKIKLKEPRSFTKDRIVTLAYGNMFFDLLENKLSKEEQRDTFSDDDWKNIIIM